MILAHARDEATPPAGAEAPATRAGRWLPVVLAALVLLAGGFGLLVRHAPSTTWAVPIRPGPLVGDAIVWEVRRTPSEVRVEVGPKGDVATVRVVERHHPDLVPGEVATARTRLLPDGGAHVATPAEVEALAGRVRASEAAWPRPPAFVAAVGKRATPLQHAEQVILEALIAVWLAGLVATVRGWWPRVRTRRPRAWGELALLLLLQHALIRSWHLTGVWHSNQHGYDRIADVAQQTPPAQAALGLLHGYGYYALFQPLAQLTGLDVLALAPWVGSAVLVVAFAWLRLLWQDGRSALVGVAALLGPVFLRLSASEDMYLPAALWIVATFAALELYLRDDRDRWLLLALPPAFLAMQTRAELTALVPAWAGLMVVLRKPGWLKTAWRRPAVVGGLLVAAGLFVPRLLALRASPPPEDLRRASLDPLRDARLLVLGALVLAGVAAIPWVRTRLATWSRRTWLGVGALGVALLAGWAVAVIPTGGPLEHTWEVHTALDPRLSTVVPLLAAWGAVRAGREGSGTVSWLLLSLALGLVVYLPQYDCFSTYVRTSLATWPLVAALVAPLGRALPVGGWRPAAVAAGVLALALPGLPRLAVRDAKQLQGDLVAHADATLPPDAVLVWLSDRDVAADAKARGYRTTRARLDHWLPERTTVGIDAWRRGDVPAGAPTFFVRTADCHRVLFQPRGQRALAGGDEVAWRYLDTSRVSTGRRVAVDVGADWIDPRCAAVLATATATVEETPLPDHDAGSVYETTLGAAAIGLYRVPSRP